MRAPHGSHTSECSRNAMLHQLLTSRRRHMLWRWSQANVISRQARIPEHGFQNITESTGNITERSGILYTHFRIL